MYLSLHTYAYTYMPCLHTFKCIYMYVCFVMQTNMKNKERDREIHSVAILASQKMPP